MVVSEGSVGVKVNGEIGSYFHTGKELRQRDPLLSILFNLVANILATLISRAKANGLFRGLVPDLVEDGILILQYTYDTILFMENGKNLKLVLCTFEKLSHLKISFYKSELFLFQDYKGFENGLNRVSWLQGRDFPFQIFRIIIIGL
jgi:hypothetical protein